jgi:hypothetical protein
MYAGVLFGIISCPGKCASALESKRVKARVFFLQAVSQQKATRFVHKLLGVSVEIDTDALDPRR